MKSFALQYALLVALFLPLAGQDALFAQMPKPWPEIQIDTDTVIGHVDPKVYGHFLEHIYHSVDGGIWGEILFDRSFEEHLSDDPWTVGRGEFVSPTVAAPSSRFAIGSEAWADYDASLEVRMTSDRGTIGVGFRVTGKNGYLLRLGRPSDEQHTLTVLRGSWDRERIDQQKVATAAGVIEPNTWYKLRIRCEGSRAQIWLDGKQIFDQTGLERKNGQMMLYTFESNATFRNVHAVKMDGNDLLSETTSPARHWNLVGSARAELDADKPLNSHLSLHLTTDLRGGGVEQGHLKAGAHDVLRGSLWLRGTAPSGVTVQLLNGKTVLAIQKIQGIEPEWKEFALELTPSTSSSEATLQIAANGKASLGVDQVVLMPDSARATGGFRPDLLKAMADLHPSIIRWPGGSFVGEYEWKTTVGPQSKRVGKRGWDEWDPLAFGIDEYMQLVRKLGAEPLVVVYMGPHNLQDRSKYIQDAKDFVEYCNGPATSTWGRKRAENGHPEPYGIKYWEIDNEVWGNTPDNYVAALRSFIPAMKSIDASISVIACGSGNFGDQWGDGDIAVIDQAAELVDYLSIHRYEGPDGYKNGSVRAELFWGQLAERIAQSKNPRMRLFISEWNADLTDWRTGLYAAGELNAFERNPVVGMASPALWLRHVTAPSWNNSFINFDQSRWFPAPNYVVMKLYRDFFEPDVLRVSHLPADLSVVATKSADGRKILLKLVNPRDTSMKIRVRLEGKFVASEVKLHRIAPDSLTAANTLDQPDFVHAATTVQPFRNTKGELELPRWSVNVIELDAP